MTSDEFLFALKTLGVSQAEFARWIDVSAVTVNRWARGKQPIPVSIKRLLVLAKLNHDVLVDIDGVEANPLVDDNLFQLDGFKVLGVTPETPEPEIRKTYLNLMKQHHPDVGGSPKKAAQVSAAYQAIRQTLGASSTLSSHTHV